MQTTVEQLDETSVKLTLTVEPQRVASAIDAAATALAGQVKIPGFRQGRVPRKVLQARIGAEALQEEALRTALPGLYEEAVRDADVAVVGSPQFEVEAFEEGREAVIHATVDVRPDFEVPAYEGLQVAHPEWEVTDEELDLQLAQLQERFAELETVERPVKAGDFVVVTITARRGEKVIDEASGEDLLYEVPTAETDAELDRQLQGTSAGQILKFSDILGADFPDGIAGQEADFTVIVKEVKSKQLPELDDDFALSASEFDTIAELRADVGERVGRAKRFQARQLLRGKVVEAVTELADFPLPPSLVAEESAYRLDRLAHEASHYGMTMEQYLQVTGRSMDELQEEAERGARETVKSMLVLDAVGRAAGIEVEQSDLGEELARQSMRLGRPVQEMAELMLQPGRINALAGDAYRRKTIDHLVESVEVLAGPPPELEAADEAALEAMADEQQQAGKQDDDDHAGHDHSGLDHAGHDHDDEDVSG